MISFHQAAAAAVVVAADDDGSGLWLPETANLTGTQSQKSSSPQHFSEKSCTQPIHPAHHHHKTQSLYFNSLTRLVCSNPHSKQQQEQEDTTEEATKEEQEQEQEARTEQEKD
jgi:hypothetical protein